MDPNSPKAQPPQTPQPAQPQPAPAPATPTKPPSIEVFSATNQQPAAPLAPVTQAPVPPPPKKKRSFLKIFLILIFVIILLTGAVGSALGYAIAYEKIDINNDEIQATVASVVMSLPFAPKTPRYVLQNALIAHSQISSHSFDVSLSIASDTSLPQIGLSSFDLKAVGAVDYADLKNINFTVDVDITNQAKARAIKDGNTYYLKVDKLPTAFYIFLGVESEKINPVLENWLSYDDIPIESEARSLVEEGRESKSFTNEIAQKMIDVLLNKEILKSIKLDTESYEEVEVYKLVYSPSTEDIDKLGQELINSIDPDGEKTEDISDKNLSDVIKSMEIIIRFDKNTHLLKWASLTSTIKSTDDLSDFSSLVSPYINDGQNFDIAFVLKLDNFNEEIDLNIPVDSLTVEKYVELLIEAATEEEGSGGLFSILSKAINPSRQFAQTRDTQRKTDLLQITNAIYQYAAEHDGNLPDEDGDVTTSDFPIEPTCIGKAPQCWNAYKAGKESGDFLIPLYIAAMPEDPSTGHEQDTGYKIHLNTTNGRIVISAVGEEVEDITIER